MQKRNIFIISAVFISMVTCSLHVFYKNRPSIGSDSIRICFYNVENLFDPYDDPQKDDDIFAYGNIKGWNTQRFKKKCINVAKVILGLGKDSPPGFVGLAEIENEFVLKSLLHDTPLKYWEYGYIHKESPDKRGIDVAAIYRKSILQLHNAEFIRVNLGDPFSRPTRFILAATMTIPGHDTIAFIVNHWPSRYGGKLESDKRRVTASKKLVEIIDSIVRTHSCPLVVMGDFNDNPTDKSLLNVTSKSFTSPDGSRIKMKNISMKMDFNGTLKYNALWYTFDQILVSENLMNISNYCYIANKNAMVYHPGFLLCEDDKFPGEKPFRTFYGNKYWGGFSDHLPVYIDLKLNSIPLID